MLKSNALHTTCTLAILTVIQAQTVWAKDAPRFWDQKRAEDMVQEVLEQEEAHTFAWNTIDWLDDPQAAKTEAEKQQKPILVYFFLRGKVGPAAAPC